MTFYVYDSGGSGSPFIVADYDTVSAGGNSAPVLADAIFTISENTSIGAVVGTVVGTDTDLDTLTYSILSGNTNGDLAINSITGVITVVNSLSYTRTQLYSLVVQANDGELSGQGLISVSVDRLAGVWIAAPNAVTIWTNVTT